MLEYDKRKGWRGPLANKKTTKGWNKDIKKFYLEKSIGWEMAIVKKVEKFSIEIETTNKSKGKINLNDIEKGIICEFQLEELKAPLSKKTAEYLQEQGITLNEIIQFELKEFKVIDENI